jgi:tetraacyldisaccharide 4'-kinase
LPFAVVFWLVVAARRLLFRTGLLRTTRLPVPVVVVGNISAGGTGKTPLAIWLCQWLREHGYRPGIVTRGYGGSGELREVFAHTAPAEVGDEPVLLARRTGCPVWAGRDRVAAARALLATHPDCNVIVSDDGLQHYRLRRDVEIVVVDGNRGFGNGLPLPAGPLREPRSRLAHVDAIVVNGPARNDTSGYAMRLEGTRFRNLLDPGRLREAADFRGLPVQAVAGIGNPQRFFEHLRGVGLEFSARAFPDHHDFTATDLAFAGETVMTEKDAIKCERFARETFWVLAVDAQVDPRLGALVLEKLKAPHGS